jgi:hypothetical protein
MHDEETNVCSHLSRATQERNDSVTVNNMAKVVCYKGTKRIEIASGEERNKS